MEGAQTSIHLAVADEVADITGEYFSECKVLQFLKSKSKNPNPLTRTCNIVTSDCPTVKTCTR